MQDFYVVESVFLPRYGQRMHTYAYCCFVNVDGKVVWNEDISQILKYCI